MRWIPLWGRDGVIRDWTCVDDEDFRWLSEYGWHLHSEGYAVRTVTLDSVAQKIRMAREILGLTWGDGLEADHRNRNRLDNRRENLRAGPHGMNIQNLPPEGYPRQAGPRRGTRGVSWHKASGRWRVRVEVEGRVHSCGYFDSREEAVQVARAARMRLMPYAT